MKRFFIGCSGWSYGDWIGRFYPAHTSPRELLPFYAEHFATVEIDMTFYRFPSSSAVRSWRERTPEGFRFAAKLNRTITHFRRLRGADRTLDSFLDIISGLGDKLGPVLVQLPPNLGPDHSLLEDFLSKLPPRMSFAVEFRDPRWSGERTFDLLERYGVALCLIDSDNTRIANTVTAPFAYVRWHGRSGAAYDYGRDELEECASVMEGLDAHDIYGFFNNDVWAHAPFNAEALASILKERQLLVAA